MSYRRLTSPVLRRLTTAGPLGWPHAPTRTNILTSPVSHKSCASFTSKRCLATSPASHLSTKRQPSSDTAHHNSPSSSSHPPGGAPAPDEFGFKGLGMTRGVKIVVYAVVGILGTMETIFWAKVLWRWWSNRGEEDEPQ